MNELASNEASLRKRGGIFIVQGYLMPLRVGNELVLGNGLESDPAKPIRIFISPSCLCFFVFATCFHSLQSSFHVEENMNNPSLLLQFQPPTETDELALSHRPHSLERHSALPAWSGDCRWPMRELEFPVQTWLLWAPHGDLAGGFLRRGLASGLCRQFKRCPI